jgi:hypothetical protein
MTFFVENDHQLFERFDEEHYQRTFELDDYFTMLTAAGFTDIEVTADFTNNAPTEESNRLFIRAKK